MEEQTAEAQAPADGGIAPETSAPEADSGDKELSDVWERMHASEEAPEPEGQEDAGAAAEPDPEQAGEEDTPADPSPADQKDERLGDLPKEVRDVWETFTPQQREAIKAGQGELSRKLTQQGREIGALKPMREQLIELAREFPVVAKMTPEQFMERARDFARIDQAFSSNPVQALMGLVQQHGLQDALRQAIGGDQGQPATQYVQQLEAKVARLEQALDPNRMQEQFREYSTRATVESQVADFAKGAEHWQAVEPYMPQAIGLVQNALGENASATDVLTKAYELAVSQFVPEAQKAKEEPARPAAPDPDPARAAAAQKAKSINVAGTQSGKARPLTEDELLAKTWDRIQARA